MSSIKLTVYSNDVLSLTHHLTSLFLVCYDSFEVKMMKLLKRKRHSWVLLVWVLMMVSIFIVSMVLAINGAPVMKVANVADADVAGNMGSYVSSIIGAVVGGAIGIFGAISTQGIIDYLADKKAKEERCKLACSVLKSDFNAQMNKAKYEVIAQCLEKDEIAKEYARTHGFVWNDEELLDFEQKLVYLSEIDDFEGADVLRAFYMDSSFFNQSTAALFANYRLELERLLWTFGNTFKDNVKEYFEQLDFLDSLDTSDNFFGSLVELYLFRQHTNSWLILQLFERFEKSLRERQALIDNYKKIVAEYVEFLSSQRDVILSTEPSLVKDLDDAIAELNKLLDILSDKDISCKISPQYFGKLNDPIYASKESLLAIVENVSTNGTSEDIVQQYKDGFNRCVDELKALEQEIEDNPLTNSSISKIYKKSLEEDPDLYAHEINDDSVHCSKSLYGGLRYVAAYVVSSFVINDRVTVPQNLGHPTIFCLSSFKSLDEYKKTYVNQAFYNNFNPKIKIYCPDDIKERVPVKSRIPEDRDVESLFVYGMWGLDAREIDESEIIELYKELEADSITKGIETLKNYVKEEEFRIFYKEMVDDTSDLTYDEMIDDVLERGAWYFVGADRMSHSKYLSGAKEKLKPYKFERILEFIIDYSGCFGYALMYRLTHDSLTFRYKDAKKLDELIHRDLSEFKNDNVSQIRLKVGEKSYDLYDVMNIIKTLGE